LAAGKRYLSWVLKGADSFKVRNFSCISSKALKKICSYKNRNSIRFEKFNDTYRLLDFEILADPFQVLATRHFLHEGLNLPLVQRVTLGHLKIEIEEFKDS